MSYVGKISAANLDHFVASTAYGTCSTASTVAAKIVDMPDFDTLLTGVTIHVLFQNSNLAENPTLNVNNTGAKSIYINGITPAGEEALTSWDANSVVSFTYDGSAWRMNDPIKAARDRIQSIEQNYAVRSIIRTGTAYAAGWSDATPPTQEVAVTGVTSTGNIIVGFSDDITSAQYDVAIDAKLVCTGQGANKIIMTCYGYTPTVNIPLSVVILG